MKKITTIFLAAITLVLAGCVVTSLEPYYSAKDLVFEPALLGDWVAGSNSDGVEIWKFDQSGPLTYHFTDIKNDSAQLMGMHAFKLDGQLFLDIDVNSTNQDIAPIPQHFLMKVKQTAPTLQLASLNNDWLKAMLEKTPNAVAHHLVKAGDSPNDTRVLMTGSTEDLQKFIRQYVTNRDAWNDDFVLPRQYSPAAAPSVK